jgi:hypothetical protein
MTTTATPLSIYQLRIVLRGISPLIWRRVLVPSKTTLAHLHTMLQILFAWSDEHLHNFHIHGREYGSSGANTHHVDRKSPIRRLLSRGNTSPLHNFGQLFSHSIAFSGKSVGRRW